MTTTYDRENKQCLVDVLQELLAEMNRNGVNVSYADVYYSGCKLTAIILPGVQHKSGKLIVEREYAHAN